MPKATGAALQLILSLALLRYLGPDQFGVLAVCLSVIILSDAVLGAAFDTAVLRQAPLYCDEGPTRSLQVQQAGLLLKPLCGLVAAVPLVLFSSRLSTLLFQRRGSKTLLYLSALSVLGLLVLRSVQTHFQVNRKFSRYGTSDLLHNSVRYGGTALLLAIHAATPVRVVALYAAAPVIIALTLLAVMARPLLLAPVSTRAIGEVLGLIKSYLPTAAVGSITTRMDLLFVTSLASVAQAGIFAAAQTMILAPQMIGMYLAVVFAPRIMPLWKAGQLRPVYRRFQRFAILGCCAAYIVALATMSRFVAWLMPASFRSATSVALVLLPSSLTAFMNFPWTVSFLLFLKPRFLLKFDLIALPILAVGYAAMVPAYGAAGAAAVTTAYALIKTTALQKAANKILHDPLAVAHVNSTVADRELQPAGRLS